MIRIRISSNGNKVWYKDNKWHREDGPAKEMINGNREWYYEGKLHRADGGPAVERDNGYKEWWIHGDLYLIENTYDQMKWFRFGIKFNDKYLEKAESPFSPYFIHHYRREHKPEYYLKNYPPERAHDMFYHFPEDFIHLMPLYLRRMDSDCPKLRRYYHNGLLHRENGPAIETIFGITEWWHHGLRHRVDGPAFEINHTERKLRGGYQNGDKEWWLNGKLHREDGPAIDYYRLKVWCIHGEIHRDGDEPAVEADYYSQRIWYSHGKIHRENDPAIISILEAVWYKHGRRHRTDGPAVINITRPGKTDEWYINDRHIAYGDVIFNTLIPYAIILSPLELPAYVVQWILEYVTPNITKINQVRLIQVLQGIRDSRSRIKAKRMINN